MKKIILAACALAVSVTLSSPQAFADPAGELKYRKTTMKSVGGHMGSIVGILKQNTANSANLQVHADGMVALAGITASLFPKGSNVGETTVLPLVWEKTTEFAAAIKQFQDASMGLSMAAKTGDMAAVGAAVGNLGKSCKNCHENFREKKEKK